MTLHLLQPDSPPTRTLPDLATESATTSEHSLETLVHEGNIAMLTTQSGDGRLTSRPLAVAEVGAGTLLFLVDAGSSWVIDLDPVREVNVSICTGGHNDWISISGTPNISADPESVAKLWSPAAGTYFDGPDDARIRVLQVKMDDGEFWSAPGSGPVGRLIAVVSAVVGSALGVETSPGDHGSLT